MGVYGIIIAGWASNSKYAFIGAMRAAAQMVSYEIAMGFALVGALMAGQSMNLTEIVARQDGDYGFLEWFWLPLFPLFVDPLHRRARGDQPPPVRRGRGRERDRRGLPRRVLGNDVRGVLPRRVREHDPDLGHLVAACSWAAGSRPSTSPSCATAGAPLVVARRPRHLVAARQGRLPDVRLPLGARLLPALPLRPDHAAGLEGVHPHHARLDRGRRRDDDGAASRAPAVLASGSESSHDAAASATSLAA